MITKRLLVALTTAAGISIGLTPAAMAWGVGDGDSFLSAPSTEVVSVVAGEELTAPPVTEPPGDDEGVGGDESLLVEQPSAEDGTTPGGGAPPAGNPAAPPAPPAANPGAPPADLPVAPAPGEVLQFTIADINFDMFEAAVSTTVGGPKWILERTARRGIPPAREDGWTLYVNDLPTGRTCTAVVEIVDRQGKRTPVTVTIKALNVLDKDGKIVGQSQMITFTLAAEKLGNGETLAVKLTCHTTTR